MNKNIFTYKKSGVDIKSADKFVNFISTNTPKKKLSLRPAVGFDFLLHCPSDSIWNRPL